MARKNHTFQLAERPQGLIVPGRTFNLVETDAPTADQLKDGDILVETIWLSLDPSMRCWLYDRASYTKPTAIGEKMNGAAVARVLASKSSKAKVGDLVFSISGWTEVAIVSETSPAPPEGLFEPIELPEGTIPRDALGAAGITGLSAYFGMKHIGKPKPGETVVVSAAAGATGSVAGQIAKIWGARVVGITGSDEKCELLTKQLGFDAAVNYKSPTFDEDLAKATPDNIDVYFDNVGGEILEKAIDRAALRARFVLCGCISEYNKLDQVNKGGIRSTFDVIAKSIRMEGFILWNHMPEFPEARQQLGQWIAEGKLKRLETVVKGGLQVADSTIGYLFDGRNVGKLIVEVKSLEEASG
ncbi:NAD(P)-binding protein [Hypoxylon sp. FL1857]|nr:NAD(P)-binding protein [Hypoxylon sp. FL1857]